MCPVLQVSLFAHCTKSVSFFLICTLPFIEVGFRWAIYFCPQMCHFLFALVRRCIIAYKRNKFYATITDEIVSAEHYNYIRRCRHRYNRLTKKGKKMYNNIVFVDETYYDNYLRLCNDILKESLTPHLEATSRKNNKYIPLLTDNAEYNALLILGFEETSLTPTATKNIPVYAGIEPLS